MSSKNQQGQESTLAIVIPSPTPHPPNTPSTRSTQRAQSTATTTPRSKPHPAAEHAAMTLRACKYMERCAAKLHLSLPLASLAKIWLHRFYAQPSHTFAACEYHEVGAGLLFLSGKLGEVKDYRKIRLVAEVCGAEAKKRPIDLSPGSSELTHWKRCILYYEEMFSASLGFNLLVKLPYTSILDLCQQVKGSLHLVAMAFSFCADALNTHLAISCPPHWIGVACMYSAVLSLHLQTDVPPLSWWTESQGIPETDFHQIVREIVLSDDRNVRHFAQKRALSKK